MTDVTTRIWIPLLALAILSGCATKLAKTQNAAPLPAAPPEHPASSADTRAKRVKTMPGDQPDKAAEFYLMKRAGEGARDLPYEKYEAAQRRIDRMPAFSLSRNQQVTAPTAKQSVAAIDGIDLGGWQALGPGNQGGRTRHLLIHPGDPRIMYAGAATGGVWKTTDGGVNWRPVSDSFPALGIGGLTFEPGNPDTIYAGTGFWFNSLSSTNVFGSAPRGAGIFRTRDAGETWEKLPGTDTVEFRYINEILVSRQDVSRIYAATWTGIFRSLDGGQSWSRVVNRGGPGQNGCQDMVMRTDQSTDYLFAACGTTPASGPVILRNTDASSDEPWVRVYSNPAMGNTTLALAPSNQSIIYALIASNGLDSDEWRNSLLGVWRSTANGAADTWEARVTNQDPVAVNTGLLSTNSGFYSHLCSANGQRSIGGQGWIHNAIAVDPQDPDRVYTAGIDIYRSDDGGRNWGIASFWQAADGPNGAHADVLGLVYPPDFDGASKPHLYAVTDGGVYLTQNSRAATATGDRAGCTPYANVVNWRPLHGGYQSTQFYSGAVLPGGGAYFGGKQDNGTMRGTPAGGNEWVRLRGGDGAAVAFDPRDPNTLFVSVQNFGLARSRNGGRTLTQTLRGINEPSGNFAFIAPLAMDRTNPDRLYAGARIFYRTDDQADSWKPVSTQLPTAQGYVSAIAGSPVDPSRVIFATNQGYLFWSRNALDANSTTTWDFARPRPGYVPAVTFDPVNPDVAYAVYSQFNTAAGQNHVYRTADGGATWTGVDGSGDSGIPDIPVLAVTVDPLDSNRVYLGTDLGVFVSTDGASTWARDLNPFASVPTEALVIERGAGVTQLYAFTFGRGVWRTTLPGSGESCTYRLAQRDMTISAFGGDLATTVDTRDGCAWTAVPVSGGADVLSPASGAGAGSVRFTIPMQTTFASRRFSFHVQEESLTVTQAPPVAVPLSANFAATPAGIASIPYLGILDTRTMTSDATDPTPSCASTAPAKTVWYRVTPAASGTMEIYFEGRRYDVAGNSGVIVSAYAGPGGPELGCAAIPRNTGVWIGRTMRIPVNAGQSVLIMAGATGSGLLDGGFTILGVRMAPAN